MRTQRGYTLLYDLLETVDFYAHSKEDSIELETSDFYAHSKLYPHVPTHPPMFI